MAAAKERLKRRIYLHLDASFCAITGSFNYGMMELQGSELNFREVAHYNDDESASIILLSEGFMILDIVSFLEMPAADGKLPNCLLASTRTRILDGRRSIPNHPPLERC